VTEYKTLLITYLGKSLDVIAFFTIPLLMICTICLIFFICDIVTDFTKRSDKELCERKKYARFKMALLGSVGALFSAYIFSFGGQLTFPIGIAVVAALSLFRSALSASFGLLSIEANDGRLAIVVYAISFVAFSNYFVRAFTAGTN
jgi:hypothetical protein